MYDELDWNEIQFTDDVGFTWEEVVWDEPEPLPPSYIWELTEEELEAMADVPFGAFDEEERPSIDDYPSDELRGPFLSEFDAWQYASQIHGAMTDVVYDEYKDIWWVWVGGSDGNSK